jgi:hypothetical protein
VGLTAPHCKNKLVMKCHKGPRTWTNYLDKRPKLKKMDMRFGMWNVRSLYRAGSLVTVAKEISKYELDLVRVQKVRWDRGSIDPADQYTPCVDTTCVEEKSFYKPESVLTTWFRL